ncbi:toxin C-terminal domain-containing protein [Caballeronia sp. dw_19]|uniref:toxin C-terminal domain-containing protein n=1 Tax=Caballeronia sp. dw_19 TaxID=2719791 RepID=UPI003211BC4A
MLQLGLYYYKAQMYSPTLGRFLQTDPVGYADDLNWYAYAGNNPVNFSDPTGLAACSEKSALTDMALGGPPKLDSSGCISTGGPSVCLGVASVKEVSSALAGAVNSVARAVSGPVYATTKEATAAAEALGYSKTSAVVNGQAVYQKGNNFITRDIDGHNGGAWKMADSVKNLTSKDTRLGTFSTDLTRIGN